MSNDTETAHAESCGCVWRSIDVPDDQAIGQGWVRARACDEHTRKQVVASEMALGCWPRNGTRCHTHQVDLLDLHLGCPVAATAARVGGPQ